MKRSEDQFWARVDKGECWVWTGSQNSDGYGRLVVDGRAVMAHRYSYELLAGPIPAGLTLDHLCRNRACVNPAHMEPVTVRENVLRGIGITARAAVATECKAGHLFTEANTYRTAKGWRVCRECTRTRQNRNQPRRRALQREVLA